MIEEAAALASKLRAAASFFSRYLSLFWRIIFRCAEISGIYSVGLIFGYTKKGVVLGKGFYAAFSSKRAFPNRPLAILAYNFCVLKAVARIFQNELIAANIWQSKSRIVRCIYNAPINVFFGLLKIRDVFPEKIFHGTI